MQLLLRFLLVKTKSVDGIPGSLEHWVKQLHVTKKNPNDKKNLSKSLKKIFRKDSIVKEKDAEARRIIEIKLLK